jgi:ABC-type transport system involved in cytochrome c biogenesis permease subunit
LGLTIEERTMHPLIRYLPHGVLAVAVVYLIGVMIPPASRSGEFHFAEFATVPVVDGGRVKPFDTVARVQLMIVSNRQTWTDSQGKSQPAVRWLLDVLTAAEPMNNSAMMQDRVYRIDNDQLLNLLGLEARAGFRYALGEFQQRIPQLYRQAAVAERKKPADRDKLDDKALDLAHHVQQSVKLTEWDNLFVVPPPQGTADWQKLAPALREAKDSRSANPPAYLFAEMLMSYARNDVPAFNGALSEYHAWMETNLPAQMRMTRFETFFNHFAPFYHCAILYVLAFLLACFAWLGYREQLNKAALWLIIVTLVIHTFALIVRMYLMDRWLVFVTNLYSSAIFIGWVAVISGAVLESLFQNGMGNIVGSVIGFLTMIIAHHLGSDGDTLEMMQAVLDTNFWLATHVTTVTIGYAATFFAGILGIAFVLLGLLTPRLDQPLFKSMTQMIYGIICFATLFSFVGTVLGGIWADVSWGRFWGWDPKENGALIIVMWNALALHARWAGMVKQRGMALLAIFGNVVTSWSWFGVNMLNTGLHSYGPMSGAWWWLGGFWVSQLALIGVGLIPTEKWRSFGNVVPPAPEKPAPSRKHRRRDAPQPVGAN